MVVYLKYDKFVMIWSLFVCLWKSPNSLFPTRTGRLGLLTFLLSDSFVCPLLSQILTKTSHNQTINHPHSHSSTQISLSLFLMLMWLCTKNEDHNGSQIPPWQFLLLLKEILPLEEESIGWRWWWWGRNPQLLNFILTLPRRQARTFQPPTPNPIPTCNNHHRRHRHHRQPFWTQEKTQLLKVQIRPHSVHQAQPPRARDARGGHALRAPPRPRALRLPGRPEGGARVPDPARDADERAGPGNGVGAGENRVGVREEEEQEQWFKVVGGRCVEDLLQREEVWVREPARVWAWGVEDTEGRGAHIDGSRGFAGGRVRRRRGYVHESQVWEGGGVQRLWSLLHDEPWWCWWSRTQHLLDQSLASYLIQYYKCFMWFSWSSLCLPFFCK